MFPEEQGIQTNIHDPIPIHLQKAYAGMGYGPGDFPAAEELARTELSIPLCPGLTEEQTNRVVSALNRF